ncbi:MAG: porin [Nitrosomonadales bacterium]|nr:porin [Nitrosomonadales bacterium]
MQKKIIALAIAAAFSAPAMADVTMYGIVDAAVVNVSASGQKSDLLAYSGGLSGSRIGAKGAEDLDNGMKAVVVLEYALDTQSSDAIGVGAIPARQEMLALAGGFGTVATGFLQTTGYDFAVKFDPTSGSAVSPLQNVTKGRFLIGTAAVAARAPRALAYISPDMGGVTVAVNYSTALGGLGNLTLGSGATTGLKTTAMLLSATYTGVDKLVVGAVYADTANSSTGAGGNGTTDLALGASYDLGVAKLMGTYQTSKVDNGTGTDKAISMTAVAPVGPGAVVFTYAKNTIASTAAADSANGMTLAWLQGLSKTTTLYAAYSKMSQDSGTRAYSVIGNALAAPTLDLGGGSTLIAVGLKKAF